MGNGVLHPTIQQVNLCKSKTDEWNERHHQVNTWIPLEDYELLIQLAQSSKVRISVYLRAIITDALEDERERAAQKAADKLEGNLNCKAVV